MPAHSEKLLSPYSSRQLFALVVDIERYPEFLPWCRAARILERKDGELRAELIISYMHMSERYTSRVTLSPPAHDHAPASIEVAMVEGPFEHLTNSWRFTPVDGGTQIDFVLDFQFRSRLLERLMGAFFTKATARMGEAFRDRADQLYHTNT